MLRMTNNKLVIRSIEIKKEAKNVIFWSFEKTYERKKDIASMENNIEIIGIVILVKVDVMI